MIEAVMFRVVLRMKSGRDYTVKMTEQDIDLIYDIMFLRDDSKFLNVGGEVFNISEVEYMEYKEIETKEEH